GYVLCTGDGPIGTADSEPYNVTIAAPYVIVRGLKLKGAKQDAIRLMPGAHDVVIEDNDISGWGRFRYTNSKGWKIGMDMDAGVRAVCSRSWRMERTIVQRNRIHHPLYGSNSWSWDPPAGPAAASSPSARLTRTTAGRSRRRARRASGAAGGAISSTTRCSSRAARRARATASRETAASRSPTPSHATTSGKFGNRIGNRSTR